MAGEIRPIARLFIYYSFRWHLFTPCLVRLGHLNVGLKIVSTQERALGSLEEGRCAGTHGLFELHLGASFRFIIVVAGFGIQGVLSLLIVKRTSLLTLHRSALRPRMRLTKPIGRSRIVKACHSASKSLQVHIVFEAHGRLLLLILGLKEGIYKSFVSRFFTYPFNFLD